MTGDRERNHITRVSTDKDKNTTRVWELKLENEIDYLGLGLRLAHTGYHISKCLSYKMPGYPFISVVIYAVHATLFFYQGHALLRWSHWERTLRNGDSLLHTCIIICDPTPANKALCGKINLELWAKCKGKSFSKLKICLKTNFDMNSGSS